MRLPANHVSKAINLNLIQDTVELEWEANGHSPTTTVRVRLIGRIIFHQVVGMVVVVVLDKMSFLVLNK